METSKVVVSAAGLLVASAVVHLLHNTLRASKQLEEQRRAERERAERDEKERGNTAGKQWKKLRTLKTAVRAFQHDPLHSVDPERQRILQGAEVPDRPGLVRQISRVKLDLCFTIALTGGPCGGKSSSLDHFCKEMTARGFDVYCAPETPTILMNGGCRYPGLSDEKKLMAFEKGLVQLQLQMENSFIEIARSASRPSIVVFDRGLADARAYMPPQIWQTLLSRLGMSLKDVFGRYDLVLHLVTAADGAEKFYTTKNNTARKETPQEARDLDVRTQEAWRGHENHVIIRNGGDFASKLQEATDAVVKMCC